MARRIADEDIRLNVIINGDPAKKELFKLEEAQRGLRKETSKLKEEKDKLKRAGDTESARYKELTAQIKANNLELKTNESRMSELRNAIGVTGLTINQLRQRANELKTSLLHMTPGSAQFKQMQAELSAINARMSQLRANSQAAGLSLGKVADGFNRYAALGASVIATTTGVVLGLSKTIGYSKELDDKMADVRKTTGLTVEELTQLDSVLGQLKTRTSRLDLLSFAEEAGRLGKTTVEDVGEFVEVANKVSVALGSDFKDNVDETVRVMGKLAEQYRIGAEWGATNAQGMEMVGSAINEVGMAGSNTAPYLVDYLKRLTGISSQAKISAQDQIGFAAAFDEAGQSVEVSATVMSNLITKMMKKPQEFADAAKMPLDEFKKLLTEDVNEAILAFASGVNSGEAGLAAFVENIGDLGVDGQRATGVLGTLASNVDKIRVRQELANIALLEATSLQDEYNIKNNNFAAVSDKIQKKVLGFVANNGLTNWLRESIVWFGGLLNVTEDADGRFDRLRGKIALVTKIILIGITALVSYKAALVLVNLWSQRVTAQIAFQNIALKANALANGIARGATLLFAASKAVLTGNTIRATAAMKLFNASFAFSPLAPFLAVVAAAVVAYNLFSESADRATKAQRALNAVKREGDLDAGPRVKQIERLVAIAKDETNSLKEREAAIKALKEIAPDHLKNLELEKIGYLETRKAIDELIEGIRLEAKTKATKDLLEQKYKEQIDLENKSLAENATAMDVLWAKTKQFFGGKRAELTLVEKATEKRKQAQKVINDEIQALEQLNNELFKENALRNNSTSSTSTVTETISETQPLSDEKLKALEKLKEKILELNREIELSLMEADKREVEAVRDKYNKLIEENKQFTAQVKELAELREKEVAVVEKKQQERRAEAAKNFMAKYQKETLIERLDLEIAQADELMKLGILNEEQYDLVISALRNRYLEERQKEELATARERDRLLRRLGVRNIAQQYEYEMTELQSALEKQLISYEEFLKAKQLLDTEYRANYRRAQGEMWAKENAALIENVRLSAEATRQLVDMVNSLKDLELARVAEVTKKKGESEEEFTKRKEAAEAERNEIMKKYAHIEAMAKVSNIVASTAGAVMKSLETFGIPLGIPFAAIAGITGVAQAGIAIAEAQKIKGYEDGLYPVIDQYNRKYKAPVMANAKTGAINEPTILVGEKPEIIIDPKTKRHLEINYPEVIETIYQSAGRMRGYESGLYPQQKTMPTPTPIKDAAGVDLRSLLGKIEGLFDRGVPAYFGESEIRKIRASIRAQEENEKKRILK